MHSTADRLASATRPLPSGGTWRFAAPRIVQTAASPRRALHQVAIQSARLPAPSLGSVQAAAACRGPHLQQQQQQHLHQRQQQQQRHRPPHERLAPCGASAAAAGGGSQEDASCPAAADSGISPFEQKLGAVLKVATNLFPLWIILAALAGFYCPPLFTWFTDSYITWSLIFCMLGMGLTLTFDEILSVFTKMPQLLLLGMFLQYTVLPSIGWAISRYWGLSSSLAIGVALVSCMPGGTASNIVAYIARGYMPLSIMMTTASTLTACLTTPFLTSLLVGTLVPVNAQALFMSTIQLVLAPVLIGAALNQAFPKAVVRCRLYTPFLATLLVVFIVGSMMSTNVDVVSRSGWQIISAVFTLHSSGFALGYFISKAMGLSDKICRTNSIEVGMQSSALAAVLAKIHFPQDPMIVAPCVLSACTHATIGSLLAGYWNITSKEEEAPGPGGQAASKAAA